ncbi:MAG: polyprenyl diphosphate synthase, partial [Rhodospirillales bacterium]|nr:polyprenyl diphosphate synthase [Rhodospirillales bacterium]
MESASHKIDQTLPPPVHVAIIMDGNGRWAKARGLPRSAGHKRGAESVRKSVKGAISSGVSYLTLFGFSSENWKRPPDEIHDLMGLLRLYLKSEIKDLHKEGVRLLIIGDRENLDKDIIKLIQSSEEMTQNNTRLTLIIALSYGGRAEILHAAKQIAKDIAQGDLQISDIDEDALSDRLFTKDIPDPDLLIRTSGEQRL